MNQLAQRGRFPQTRQSSECVFSFCLLACGPDVERNHIAATTGKGWGAEIRTPAG